METGRVTGEVKLAPVATTPSSSQEDKDKKIKEATRRPSEGCGDDARQPLTDMDTSYLGDNTLENVVKSRLAIPDDIKHQERSSGNVAGSCDATEHEADLAAVLEERVRSNIMMPDAKRRASEGCAPLAKNKNSLDTSDMDASLLVAILDKNNEKGSNGASATIHGNLTEEVERIPSPQERPPTQVGAYSSSFEGGTQRRERLSFSAVGVVPEGVTQLPRLILEEDPEQGQNHGLVEANPIDESSGLPNQHAQEVDEKDLQENEQRRKKYTAMGVVVLVLFCAVIVLVLSFTLSGGNKGEEDASTAPSTTPSEAPTQAPSSAPTAALDLLVESLPNYTLASLDQFVTPQWKAMDWLSMHPELPGMPEWRKKQLFSMASFYFAMNGPNWRKEIREGWLQYGEWECYWVMTNIGSFIEATGQWEASDSTNGTICNEAGEIQVIDLVGLDISEGTGEAPFVAPEVSLLTSLRYLDLKENNFVGPISLFLPSQLYQMPQLAHLNLNQNSLSAHVPSELGLLTKVSFLDIGENALTGPLPTELGLMTSMQDLHLYSNSFSGAIPSQTGLMVNLTTFDLEKNKLDGFLPTEIGLLGLLDFMDLELNNVGGSIPSELGRLSLLEKIDFDQNQVSSQIPSQLGLLTRLKELNLWQNRLSGSIPSELFRLTDIVGLTLAENLLSGSIPSELGLLTVLRTFSAENNTLSGSIPDAVHDLLSTQTLFVSLHNNLLTGTVAGELCTMGWLDPTDPDAQLGLSFDCGEQMCGCCWCACATGGGESTINNTGCPPAIWDPAVRNDYWPGEFPTINTSNVVMLNIHTDDWPEETRWIWSKEVEPGAWKNIDSRHPPEADSLHSYLKYVDSSSMYRLTVEDQFDIGGDGNCCLWGFGWHTITNSTPSEEHAEGTVIWKATGNAYADYMHIYVWVDADGYAQVVNETYA